MKVLGALLLAVAVGLIAYFFAYQPIADRFGVAKPPPKIEAPPPLIVEVPKPTVIEMTPEPPPPPKPTPPPPPPPKVADSGMGKPVSRADADGFEPPEFPSIEERLKNWTQLPLPRPVKIMKPVEFVMTIGGNKVGSKMAAGNEAQAVGQEGNMLIVAPAPTSTARAQIAIDDTDLKATLTAAYENWKVTRTAQLKRAFLRAKDGPPPPAAGTMVAAASNDKPVKNADGTYEILLASMKAGQVTEVTPQNATGWGEVEKENKDGKDYWTIVVSYTTKTMFGDFPTAARAYILNNRVEKWLYKESGEVVP